MSGNPFRRSQFGQPGVASSTAATQSASALWDASTFFDSPNSSDTDPSLRSKPTKSKRVRIETPPPLSPKLSIEKLQEINIVEKHHAGISQSSRPSEPAPAPTISESFPTKFIDPVQLGADRSELIQDEEVVQNTRRNSETGSTVSDEATTATVANPFARTLATLEGKDASPPALPSVKIADSPDTGASKQTMDVDSFKRMLLAGDPDVLVRQEPVSLGKPLSNQPPPGEDQAKISAQRSVSTQGQVESPSSSSADSQSSDDIQSETEADTTRKRKTKPPPPAPRASRIFSLKGPQIVSFEDFAPTESLRTTIKSGSKPLPKLPKNDLSTSSTVRSPLNGERVSSASSSNSALAHVDFDATNVPSPNPKVRPPPPLARRSSEKKEADLTRRRANSGMSETSEDSMLDNDSSFGQNSRSTKAPPPPPARRGAGSKNNSISQAQPISAIEPRYPLASKSQDKYTGSDRSNITTRKVTKDAPSRASSGPAGQVKNGSGGQAPTTSTSTSAAPPLPPARRRGSSKSSTDFNVTGPSSSGTAGAQKNVLADLTAFQAEVDALRDQYKRPEQS